MKVHDLGKNKKQGIYISSLKWLNAWDFFAWFVLFLCLEESFHFCPCEQKRGFPTK
jgi:hypothetical protein